MRYLGTVALAAAATGCDNALKPDPPGGLSALVSAVYVCGNDFDIQSHAAGEMTVAYQVAGTAEQGELLLPAHTSETIPSTTRLTTLSTGALQLSSETGATAPVPNDQASCPPETDNPEPQASLGEWSPAFTWPTVAVHSHLLPGGDVLSWGRVGDPQIWHPESGTFTPAQSATMLFCSGHAFLPDGRLLATGGHLDDLKGLRDANIFDPVAQAWTAAVPMTWARWYPTSTTLPNGEVLTLGGTDETGAPVETPEVWTGAGWRILPSAARGLPYYPRTFVAPNGLVFYAGELQQSAYLDPTGNGGWTPAAASNYG